MTAADEDPLLLLASASPGRRNTLARAGLAFDTLATDLDEDAILRRAGTEVGPAEQVLLLAREKAQAATRISTERDGGGYIVLGCDSMLELDGEAVGKPHTPERATARWQQLRGRSAVLHSGHWLIDDRDPEDGSTGATLGATADAEVTFADLSDEEIAAYVATGEPLEVAGAFTIDGLGGPFITSVTGDPHAVVGVSLPLLRQLLAQVDVGIHELWSDA